MQNEWQAFLNLCLAQETHLDIIEDYKKVQSSVALSLAFNSVSSLSSPSLTVPQTPVGSLQFQLDAETLSESLERLNYTLDPKALANKSAPEVLMQLEVGWSFLSFKIAFVVK